MRAHSGGLKWALKGGLHDPKETKGKELWRERGKKATRRRGCFWVSGGLFKILGLFKIVCGCVVCCVLCVLPTNRWTYLPLPDPRLPDPLRRTAENFVLFFPSQPEISFVDFWWCSRHRGAKCARGFSMRVKVSSILDQSDHEVDSSVVKISIRCGVVCDSFRRFRRVETVWSTGCQELEIHSRHIFWTTRGHGGARKSPDPIPSLHGSLAGEFSGP